ncbi:hypothetical protein BD779DRAFT_1801038 [Infundibulicybe gibba]|nr:hypothetical protein BD779DRAFT_1801038 [Infundibulicybe gibba]
MSNLLSLPNELIIKIADQLETCKSFRGTCKRIDLIISPQVLSRLIIDISKESIDRSISQLEALARGSIRTAEYVRTIEIRHLDPTISHNSLGVRAQVIQTQEPEASWVHRKIRELLPAALSTLTGTQTVIFAMSIRNPEWASVITCEFLATLPDLRTLHLIGPVRPETHTQIHPNWNISNITKLTLRGCLDNSISDIIGNSPGLSHLDLEYPVGAFGKRIPTFHELFSKVPADRPIPLHYLRIRGYCFRLDHLTLPHLRQLRSLVLRTIPWIRDHKRLLYTPGELAKSDRFASSFSEVWGVIRREALPIEEATTPIDDIILDHLAALNGLRKLAITQDVSEINSSPLDTQTHLSAPSDSENEVLARKFFTHVLPRHHKTLVSLSISSVFESPWFLGPNVESLIKCTQLTELSITVNLSHPDVQKRTSDGAVEEVLHIAAQFPNLHRLGFSAVHEWYKRRGLPSARLRLTPGDQVTSIKSFGPVNPNIHPPFLEYGRQGFRPRRGSDGVIRYTPEYLCPVELAPI